jgi:hypothetical protein
VSDEPLIQLDPRVPVDHIPMADRAAFSDFHQRRSFEQRLLDAAFPVLPNPKRLILITSV